MATVNGDRYVTWKSFLTVVISIIAILLSLGTYVRGEIVNRLDKLQDRQIEILQEIARDGRPIR